MTVATRQRLVVDEGKGRGKRKRTDLGRPSSPGTIPGLGVRGRSGKEESVEPRTESIVQSRNGEDTETLPGRLSAGVWDPFLVSGSFLEGLGVESSPETRFGGRGYRPESRGVDRELLGLYKGSREGWVHGPLKTLVCESFGVLKRRVGITQN